MSIPLKLFIVAEKAGVHFLLRPMVTQFRNGGPRGITLCRQKRLSLRVLQREFLNE